MIITKTPPKKVGSKTFFIDCVLTSVVSDLLLSNKPTFEGKDAIVLQILFLDATDKNRMIIEIEQ